MFAKDMYNDVMKEFSGKDVEVHGTDDCVYAGKLVEFEEYSQDFPSDPLCLKLERVGGGFMMLNFSNVVAIMLPKKG